MGLASEVGVTTAEMIKLRRKPNNHSTLISLALLIADSFVEASLVH